MEAPKKIWVEIDLDHAGDLDLFFSAKGYGEEYIRADLVDGLVEALKSISETVVYADEGGHDEVAECVSIARSALKSLEEE